MHLPMELGTHTVEFPLPPRLQWVRRAGPMPATTTATVTITGHVVVMKGTAERVLLRNVATGAAERGRVQTTFDDRPSSLPVVTVASEEALQAVLERPVVSRVTIGRFPLPRIRCSFYWPPSDRMLLTLRQRNAERLLNRQPPIFADEIPFAELEGTDVNTLWEPITAAHPAAYDPAWPWTPVRHHPSAPRGRVKRRR